MTDASKTPKPKKPRLQVPFLGEWYDDLLSWDSWINNRNKVQQAQSLLCAKLQEREKLIAERLQHIADKREISVTELKKLILREEVEGPDVTTEIGPSSTSEDS